MVGQLSTVLGVVLYVFVALRIWQAAGAAGLRHRWLAVVPIAGFVLVFRLFGRSGWWAASAVAPPVFLIALLGFGRRPAARDGRLGWWWLTVGAVALMAVSLGVEFVGGQSTLGTLGLNVARLLFAFGLWELLRVDGATTGSASRRSTSSGRLPAVGRTMQGRA